MDKANIIISIIIVLCIAAAVAAYGITNSDSPIFSGLSSMGAKDDSGDGLGNNTAITNGSSSPMASSDSGSSDVGSGSSDSSGSSSSGSSDSGSSSNSGSSSSSNSQSSQSSSSSSQSSQSSSSSSQSSSSSTQLTYSQAQSIAASAISQDGCTVGGGSYSGGYWYFSVIDADGNTVDTISVSDATGATGRG